MLDVLDKLQTLRPALLSVLTTLGILSCGPISHAQSRLAAGDSTHLVGVCRLVQAINAVQEDEVRTLENEEFLAQMS